MRFILIALISFASISFAKASPAMTSPTNFGFQDLKNLIANENIDSIEGVIAKLPVEMRSHYTLVHSSRSTQASTFEKPRALMFTPGAKFVIAFTGDTSMAGGSHLETMEFSDADQDFKFRTVEFKSVPNKPNEVLYDESGANCLGCHGTKADHLHPVWANYDIWETAYGGYDDSFEDPPVALELHTSEFQAFLKSRPTLPRYKDLVDPTGTTLPPYQDSSSGSKSLNLQHRPNLHLGASLERWNALKIAKEFKQSQEWATDARMLTRKIAGCESLAITDSFVKQLNTIASTLFLGSEINLMSIGGRIAWVGQAVGLDTRNWFLEKGPRMNGLIWDGSLKTMLEGYVVYALVQSLPTRSPELETFLHRSRTNDFDAFTVDSPIESQAIANIAKGFSVDDFADLCTLLY